MNAVLRFFLEHKAVTALLAALCLLLGVVTAPFEWNLRFLPRDPVPVDAIPDIGENQQIVFTEWMGRGPRDVEDQITYPLTSALLGMPGVKSVRSTSMFGFSSISIVFDEGVEYYASRSRVLEKLASLPPGRLPEGVAPALGPDATALGQVFWYTLEGRDERGRPAGGWDLHELRSIQDFQVRNALTAVEGVAEVASIGGMVKEYQVDLDPQAMRIHGVGLMPVVEALRAGSRDVGANTIEINLVEYVVRGTGRIRSLEDIEETVVKAVDGVPVRIRDIARVNLGPAPRNHAGFLDKGGAEAVGGVVTARYGENPLRVIAGAKRKIEEIAPGLPARTLEDGRVSRVTIVPFYDRTSLIRETLATLYHAISLQVLITMIVILVLVMHLRVSLAVSAVLPLAVLMSFILMKWFGVDANIVALSGIAIAIGTVVDMGIILSENVLRHRREAPGAPLRETIHAAAAEVSPAILTAVATTIVSFLPVFALQAAEGKLFAPLAWTKTFALLAATVVTFLMLPALLHVLLSRGGKSPFSARAAAAAPYLLLTGGLLALFMVPWAGLLLMALGASRLLLRADPGSFRPARSREFARWHREHHALLPPFLVAAAAAWFLAGLWRPLGVERNIVLQFLFVLLCLAIVLGGFRWFLREYPRMLAWCLDHKAAFLAVPSALVAAGLVVWLGFGRIAGPAAYLVEKTGWNVRASAGWSAMAHRFPGLGKEFMPSLNEGSFLLMPTSPPHAGMEANLRTLAQIDLRVQAIPEVSLAVGKGGRAETALDPAPPSMFEVVIQYRDEYGTDARGRRVRQWRDHIRSPGDIWDEIVRSVADIPGITPAPRLQPIETRLVMLQTGMRAPMGIKVFGPDAESIEAFSLRLEQVLREVPSVRAEAVYADRSLGKPYLEIEPDRRAMARHGLNASDVQHAVEVAVGGMPLATVTDGRERHVVRARYARDWRESPEALRRVLVPAPGGAQIPLGEVAVLRYRAGPMMIRGEDTFLVGYVLLDKREGHADATVVEQADRHIRARIAAGELEVPAGVSYRFSGAYENQVRAERRLMVILPLTLALILLILHLQFRSIAVSLMIFSSIALAFAGGFLLLWLYGRPGFPDFGLLGLRDLFQVRPYNLSVAVWVGFIALFGLASDNGVVMASYLRRTFALRRPARIDEVRAAVLEAGGKRVRPCVMTTATTLLALLPILTSRGRGSDIMIPMSLPIFGGMAVALLTLFVVPVLYSLAEERKLRATAATREPLSPEDP